MKIKRISAASIQALKEALCYIYWYKGDLKGYLSNVLTDKSLIAYLNWGNYKRQIASDLVDKLNSNQEKYLPELLKLIDEICQINDFSHLDKLEDGKIKAENAKKAVSHLKALLKTHDDYEKEIKEIEERRKKYQLKLDNSQAVQDKLDEINKTYIKLLNMAEHKKRGFELEKVMREIFELFDLDPKASFRCTGEQIDGAFSLEGTDYIFEAKWQESCCDTPDLDVFCSKVGRKLENTLGLFLSINSFSDNAVNNLSNRGKPIILMTGADLMGVLEKRIDFVTLLLRKKRYASQTGKILLQIHEIY